MRLCIDMGNTKVKLALFKKKGKLKKLIVRKRLSPKKLEKVLNKYRVNHAILSSVRKGTKQLRKLLKKRVKTFVRLTSDTPMPIQNLYETPQTLGRDRIAAVVGASHLYPSENLLVIDAGTCITYDFVDKERQYHGGSILPGLDMRFKALRLLTDKLPLVEQAPLDGFIGKSTETSIRTGIQAGTLFETQGFIAQYRAKFDQVRVLVTGGAASFFESQLKNEIFAEPNLVLIGLHQILNYNVNR